MHLAIPRTEVPDYIKSPEVIDSRYRERKLLNDLNSANLKFQNIKPGDKPNKQAVHTV